MKTQVKNMVMLITAIVTPVFYFGNFSSKLLAADTSAPQVNIISPATNLHHGQWIGITLDAIDDTGVTKAEIYIDGKLKTVLTKQPWQWTWDNFYELDPVHHISARAYDAAGNIGYSEVVTVIIDDVLATFSRPEPSRTVKNIALGKPTNASQTFSESSSSFGVNGDENIGWNSGDFAPQWIEIDVGSWNLIDKIELVVGQYPVVGTARHEVYGIGRGGEEGLLFVLDGRFKDGETIVHPFVPPLQNISKIKVLTTQSQSWVAWRETKVFGSVLPIGYSTFIDNIYSATYFPQNEYPFQNINIKNFQDTIWKLKNLGINAVWFVLPWTDFDPNLNGTYNEQAFSKLTAALDVLKTNGMRAILPLNYGSYFNIALFENRNVWKAYQRYVADFAYRYRDYNNIIFMNFTEGSYPSTAVGQVGQRGSSHDENFKQWAYSANPDINSWNSRWGTNYTWDTIQAYRYPSTDATAGQFTSVGMKRCQDDHRWVGYRLRQGFGRLPAIQKIYGNPGSPYGFHDFVVVEGWTDEAPIPKPNQFDLVSYGFYPATKADCGLNFVKVANDSTGWVPLTEFYIKMSRLTSQFPGTQVLVGEIGVPTALSGGETDQAKLVSNYLSDIKNKRWGFNFWQAIDYPSSDLAQNYEKSHGLYRVDGSPKQAVYSMANLLGGKVILSTPTPSPSPTPTPPPTTSPTPTPTPSSTPSLTPQPSPIPITPTPIGPFMGYYYSSSNRRKFNKLLITRQGPAINFDWGFGSPAPNVPNDNFAVYWTGDINFPNSGIYNFTAVTDDGMRVWINGKPVLNKWFDQYVTIHKFDANLTAGNHVVEVAYYEKTNTAVAKLSWSQAGVLGESVPTVLKSILARGYANPRDEIMTLQGILNQLGLLSVAPTGYFGSLTEEAVKKLQTQHGLPQTGIVGEQTRGILNNR